MDYGLTGAPQLVDAIKEALEPLLQNLRASHQKSFTTFL